jgi:hypothetical protein
MGESKNQSSNKEMWGCVGAIGAALVAGIVALIIALPTLIPFFTQPTAAQTFVIMTTTSQSNTITPTMSFVQPSTLPIQSPIPTSEKFFVSATSSPGYVYTPTATGNYVFQYESGAYSTQLNDDAVLPNFTWHTAVRFFTQIKNWRDDQTSAGIAKPDWAIDVGTPYRYKESEALADIQSAMNTGRMLVAINLEQNIPIYLVIADTSPENNRGGVWLSVTQQK